MKTVPVTEHIYAVLISVLLSFSLSLSSLASTTIEYSITVLAIFSILFVVLFYFVITFRRGLPILFLTLLGTFLIAAIISISNNGIQGSFEFLSDSMNRLLDLLAFPHDLSPYIQFNITLIITGALSFFSVMCMGFSFGYIIITAFGVVFFSAQLLTNNFYLPNHNLAFFIFILAIPLFILKQVNAGFLRRNILSKLRPASAIAWIVIPLCAVVVFASFRLTDMTTNLNDFDWTKLFSNFYINDGIGEFEISAAGYSEEDGTLGGEVTIDRSPVLELTSRTPLYLTGRVKDFYDGSKWTTSVRQKVKLDQVDFADTRQTVNFVNNIRGNTRKPFIESGSVRYIGLNVRTVFTPDKASGIEISEAFDLWASKNGELFTNQFLRKDFSYDFEFYRLYMSNYTKSIKDSAESFSLDDDFERYLYIPETVTKRVKNLTNRITEPYENNYDKVIAIKNYLANFPYTLKTSSVPEERDFVDYFLFTEKKGYCTYYASALTIMSRYLGIPARYVEGYGPTFALKTENDEAFILTNEQAHAWVEVYLGDAGWNLIEATPPYDQINRGLTPSLEIFSEEMLEDPDYKEHISKTFRPIERITGKTSDASLPKINVGESEKGGIFDDEYFDYQPPVPEKFSLWNALFSLIPFIFVFVIVPVAVIVGIIILIEVINEKNRLRKLAFLSPKSKIIFYIKKILRLASYDNKPISSHESMTAFALRVNFDYPLIRGKMIEAAQIFEQASYSGQPAGTEQSGIVANIYNEFNEYVKTSHGRLGKLRYFIARYILRKL
ncbi:MAG: transglutaminase-like domain-containing protein [Oscillospiraceae bacterium]|nr:transglutaminase-like domain-containing protein [Oscillospiraceae bacterium]